MLEFLKTNLAFALLKKDHETVKDLFDRFENAEGPTGGGGCDGGRQPR